MRWTDFERLLHPIWPSLSIVASLAIVGYAIPRGLDLTDESLYVLLAQTDTPRSLSVIHTQLLFQGLEAFTGITVGIQGLRIARLILLLCSMGWLTWVLSGTVESRKKTLFALSALAFAFLQYTGNGRIFSLGYNAMNWAWGAWFIASWIRWTRDGKPWAPLGLGVALALMWITKFPSAVIMGGLGILLAVLHPNMDTRSILRAVGLALIPFLGIMVLAPWGGHEVWPWSYLDTMASSQDDKHATDSLLLHSLVQIAKTHLPLLLIAILGFLTRRHPSKESLDHAVTFLLSAAFVGLASVDLLTLRNFRVGYWLLAASLLTWGLVRTEDRAHRLGGTLLLLAPIGLTMGTDVGWPGHLMPISGLMLMSAQWLSPTRWISLTSLAIPLLILPDIALRPYRQAAVTQATEDAFIHGTDESIEVSPATRHYLDSLGILTAPYRVPMIGSDRFYGEMLAHGPENVGTLLWSAESMSPNHTQDWVQHDSLLFGLCNRTELSLFQEALQPFQWELLGTVDRRPYLRQTGRYGWGIPEQNAQVDVYLLTQAP